MHVRETLLIQVNVVDVSLINIKYSPFTFDWGQCPCHWMHVFLDEKKICVYYAKKPAFLRAYIELFI